MTSKKSTELTLECPCGHKALVLLGQNKNGSGFECQMCQRLAVVDHATLKVTWYVKDVEKGEGNVMPIDLNA